MMEEKCYICNKALTEPPTGMFVSDTVRILFCKECERKVHRKIIELMEFEKDSESQWNSYLMSRREHEKDYRQYDPPRYDAEDRYNEDYKSQ